MDAGIPAGTLPDGRFLGSTHSPAALVGIVRLEEREEDLPSPLHETFQLIDPVAGQPIFDRDLVECWVFDTREAHPAVAECDPPALGPPDILALDGSHERCRVALDFLADAVEEGIARWAYIAQRFSTEGLVDQAIEAKAHRHMLETRWLFKLRICMMLTILGEANPQGSASSHVPADPSVPMGDAWISISCRIPFHKTPPPSRNTPRY